MEPDIERIGAPAYSATGFDVCAIARRGMGSNAATNVQFSGELQRW
jgi:hypothetical protein